MVRKLILYGGLATLASLPFLQTPAPRAPVDDAEAEAARLARLCEAGLRPARDCAAPPERRHSAGGSTRPAPPSIWADPGSAERASAAILASTPESPVDEPVATGSLADEAPDTQDPSVADGPSPRPAAAPHAGEASHPSEAAPRPEAPRAAAAPRDLPLPSAPPPRRRAGGAAAPPRPAVRSENTRQMAGSAARAPRTRPSAAVVRAEEPRRRRPRILVQEVWIQDGIDWID
jgi:hypothetical protein